LLVAQREKPPWVAERRFELGLAILYQVSYAAPSDIYLNGKIYIVARQGNYILSLHDNSQLCEQY
jgi:hypothetical protein